MTDSQQPEDISVSNERSLKKLAWAIEVSVGQFKLIFAHCNYAAVRTRLVERLQQLCSVDIRILVLKESDRTLYATIQAALGEEQPDALMVLGLESVHHLDQMLTAADQVREEFRKHCQFPLVLWVNDAVQQKLVELAPNFESWGTRQKFTIAVEELANWLREKAAQCLEHQFKPVLNDCLEEAELKAARKELLNGESALDVELEAKLESLLGLAKESNRKVDAALDHYQRALCLWQKMNNLECQGYLLNRLAYCSYLKTLEHQGIDNDYCQLARDYLQQCLQIFEQTKRHDLIAKSIGELGIIFRELKDWNQLEALAEQALQFHQFENKPIELAQDYSFLAEVALAQERCTDANQLAQRSIEVLSNVYPETEQLSQLSRSRWILALAQDKLGQNQDAVRSLEAALDTCNPLDDLKLYLKILSDLHQLYFKQKDYLKAYEIKQKERSVKQQFSLQAFIGAGRLEPQRQKKSTSTQVAEQENQETIAPEILASGRQQDVEKLIERIAKNETKLIVIHGQSGVGKSSLVNAGLLPALQGKQIGTQTVRAVSIRVYTRWSEELTRILVHQLEEKGSLNPDLIATILEQLKQNDNNNLRTVLIFDQFEEFFFVVSTPIERRIFFDFLKECLQIVSVKVVFSLREDYLHYLLECNSLLSREIISYGILSDNILYPLGNFNRNEARLLLKHLTEQANYHLESDLIDKLVEDLASELDSVRPIELQVVGAQLQAERITTLEKYLKCGSKEELVKRYLAEVVKDCGEENKQVTEFVLYLLTDEKNTRPLKTPVELKRELEALATNTSQLDLVLDILVKSGLVFKLPETPTKRYQVVHDYLVAFIRRQQEPNLNRLKAELEQERQRRQKAEEQRDEYFALIEIQRTRVPQKSQHSKIQVEGHREQKQFPNTERKQLHREQEQLPRFFDAFISYARADSKAFAAKLHEQLTEQGFNVWFDQDSIPLGVDFQVQIEDALEKAHNFLFIIAPHSVNSPYCLKEIELALKGNKRIIPVLHVEQITQEIWRQRNPNGTTEGWEAYKVRGLHTSFQNLHPVIAKISWVYFRENIDDFEGSLTGLIDLFQRHADYVEQHTRFLAKALEWERHQKQTRYLLIGEERQQAESWLKRRFKDEQPPCIPTDLHCEYITESIKNANNLMTQVFMSYAHADRATMEKIRNSLRRESFTVWTNTTDIQTGEAFEEAITRGIEQADNVVYLLSPDSVTSYFCQQELDLAVSLHKRIIPVLVRETDPNQVSSALRSLKSIDLTDNVKEEDYLLDVKQLLKILHEDAAYYEEHKTLLSKALKWKWQHENPSILLRGYNLRSAETWLKVAKTRTQHPPTPLQEEFIAESLRQPPAESLDVFISYSRADSDFARKLNDALQIQGKTTWFDQESIAAGANFQQEIYRGIKACDNFLFVLSPRSVNSPYCADEVEYAAKLNKRFVTVLNREVNAADLHPELAKVQWIDFYQNEGDFFANFNQLVRTLDTDREHVKGHTKWLRRALEWEENNRSADLLLRESEFAIAQNWLQEAEQQNKRPAPTGLQTEFILESGEVIAVQLKVKKRQIVLLRSLLGLVSAALVAAIGSGVVAFRLYREVEQLRQKAEPHKQTEIFPLMNHKQNVSV